MESDQAPRPIRTSVDDEASRIIEWAARKGVVLRALGGVAVRHQCPSAHLPEFTRAPGDLDLMGRRRQRTEIVQVFQELGYEPQKSFNAYNGHRRLLFIDTAGGRDIDVFLDTFQMCHTLPLTERLELEPWSISVTDLLLTKLQIVELNRKDVKDILCILMDHPTVKADEAGGINLSLIGRLGAADWGLYTTVADNLARVAALFPEYVAARELRARIADRIGQIKGAMEAEPKAARWKLRSVVGKRIAWYEKPEESRPQGPIVVR